MYTCSSCGHGHHPLRSMVAHTGLRSLSANRCSVCVKSCLQGGGKRTGSSGQIDFVYIKWYIAETYAKLMGSISPSQPRIKQKCTICFCSRIEGSRLVIRYLPQTISRRCAAVGPLPAVQKSLQTSGARSSRSSLMPPKKAPPSRRVDVDGVACVVTQSKTRVLVKLRAAIATLSSSRAFSGRTWQQDITTTQ